MIWLPLIMLLSGLFGRLGGAGKEGNWYDGLLDTKWRDIGCSILVVLFLIINHGWQPSFWWVYLAIFGLHWAFFSTYFDKVFGYDNLAFSGLMVGLAISPILFIDPSLWWLVTLRCFILSASWWALNKFLPDRVLLWRRDVAEEFCRYAISF